MKKWLVCCLLMALLLPVAAGAEGAVSLAIEEARLDDMVIHIGTIENPREGLGIARFIELLPGVWVKVASDVDVNMHTAVAPLDDSGSFAVAAMSSEAGGGEKSLQAMYYFLLDLQGIPDAEHFSLEGMRAVALAEVFVAPAYAHYTEALEKLQDAGPLLAKPAAE